MRIDFQGEVGRKSEGLPSHGGRSEGGRYGEPVCFESAVFGWWMVRESGTNVPRASCASSTSLPSPAGSGVIVVRAGRDEIRVQSGQGQRHNW